MKKFPRKFLQVCLILLLATICTPYGGKTQNIPPIGFEIYDSAATQGYYFLSPYSNMPPFAYDRPHLILDRYGRIVYYRIFPGGPLQTPTIDFKLQPDGRMSYFHISMVKFLLMDSTFMVVDTISCTNGFATDQHDMQVLPGGHYLLFGEETRIMDLSSYHWFGFNHNQPGSTTAQVSGVVIQEFDENKNLVWEWKAHDHYQFGDVDQKWLSNANKVDWTHANAVELDHDGNVLVSLRHFDEVTKISHATGDIIWRLGGKRNQFAFPNDPVRFTGQHDIRRVNDSCITILDNGQYTSPAMCRGLEYALDETNLIATLVWEYIQDSTEYSLACGSHQLIANGNHLVDFGFLTSTNPWMVVAKPDKSKVVELSLPLGYISYRAFNYVTLPWQLNRPEVTCRKDAGDIYLDAAPGHPEYRWSTGATTASIKITQPGDYWVFVPKGSGYISSEHILITDLANACTNTGISQPVPPAETTLTSMPNPASDRIRVVFGLPSGSDVRISLHSLTGNEIPGPVTGRYPAGIHETSLGVASLARGVYLLSLATDKTQINRKVVLQ
ncbi:MAG: aryl-sulfate sulfotransferase [Bacteroidetes bacterium]|nr:aryl-sulfate sulfotransferase [Bacteroidota bacterium]